MNIITSNQQAAIDYAISAKLDYDKVKEHEYSALVNAAKCGEALIKVKEELPYGSWGNWIENNMPVNRTQCNNYIRFYENYPSLVQSTVQLPLFSHNLEVLLELAKQPADVVSEATQSGKPVTKTTLYNAKNKISMAKAKAIDAAKSYEQIQKEQDALLAKVREDLRNWKESAYSNFERGNYSDLDTVLEQVPELREKVLKLMKQYLHPDKDTGNEDLFKLVK